MLAVPSKPIKRKPLPEAISVRQTAEILGVCTLTIRRWIKRRYIKAYRVGPFLIRIPRSEISRMRTVMVVDEDKYSHPLYPRV
jgi:excisionase family DNA binding protein